MSSIESDALNKSYSFFCLKEKENEAFTMNEIVDFTGWKKATVRTYINKKWDNFLFRKDRKYFVKGISTFSLEEYKRLMSQKDKLSNDPKKPQLEIDVERLVIKARESAMLALDIYNRPATTFKTEGFTVMMIIAWTALFHAIFQRNGIDYYYLNKDGTYKIIDGDKKAWELSKCIDVFYECNNTAERNNLFFL